MTPPKDCPASERAAHTGGPAAAIAGAADVLAATRRVREATEVDPAQRIQAILGVARALVNMDEPAVAQLARESGLTIPMVRWALETTFESVTADALWAMLAAAPPGATQASSVTGGVVLSANLLTAPARALLVPLLYGAGVVVRVSERQPSFTYALRHALRAVDDELARRLCVLRWPTADQAATRTLLGTTSVSHIFGGNETITAVRQLSSTARVVGHGHGIGLLHVGPTDLHQKSADAAAIDIAAYDQRGCLSPGVVLVEAATDADALEWCGTLSGALERLAVRLPRGDLPSHIAAAQSQWRAVAQVRGELLEGSQHAVAYEGFATPRSGPGYRNISVHRVRPGSLVSDYARIAIDPRAIKCVGVSTPSNAHRIGRALGTHPSLVVAAGTMQRPPFDWPGDGRPAWHGWLD